MSAMSLSPEHYPRSRDPTESPDAAPQHNIKTGEKRPASGMFFDVAVKRIAGKRGLFIHHVELVLLSLERRALSSALRMAWLQAKIDELWDRIPSKRKRAWKESLRLLQDGDRSVVSRATAERMLDEVGAMRHLRDLAQRALVVGQRAE